MNIKLMKALCDACHFVRSAVIVTSTKTMVKFSLRQLCVCKFALQVCSLEATLK